MKAHACVDCLALPEAERPKTPRPTVPDLKRWFV